ncbi:MAG TPA: two-component regulator propeller domain-containing protein [Terriglobales bacterium]|nr:two-component regulator propeller domain-containing protein [Terriglobales bacterium]
MRRALALALLVTLVLPALLSASKSASAIYTQRVWKMQDGLPEQVVQAFAQTQDRYLWIGTTGGLVHFDGERFQVFDRDNTPAFVENNVFCLSVSRDNTLWIGLEGGGLIRYRDGVFHAFTTNDGLTNSFVRAILEDRAGNIWVATDSGLFRLNGDHLDRVDDKNDMPPLAVHALYEDRRGGIWVGGSRLFRLDGGKFVEYQLAGLASQNRVKTILETSDGVIWVGTVSGLQSLTPTGQRFQRVSDINGTVRFLRETSDGTLWIGMIGRGLHTYRDHQFSEMTAPAALPSNTLLNLFEDVEHNLWIGTQAGMVRLSKTAVQTVNLPDAADSDAETVYQDRNGDVWIAAVNLFRYHNGQATRYRFPGAEGVRVRNVFRDRDGALWIGTEGRGAYREAAGQLVQYSTENGLVNNFVRAFLQARDGSIWIATDEGVSRWRPQGITNYQMRDGLCYFSTRSLLEDRKGDIWIGTDRGVSHIHGDAFVSDAVTAALQNEKVWSLHEDPSGGLWFGTRTGGLYRWRSGKLTHFTTAQGLASNGVFELLEDKRGNLWMSGPQGISVINRRALDNAANDSSFSVPLTLYGVSEGLETIQMCGGEKPAGILTAAGEVWFPSSKGPVRIPIDEARPSQPAPVVIDRLVADGKQLPTNARIELDPDNTKLEVDFGVVLLRSQERVRFRYMLHGFDKGWSDVSTRRSAYYTNLPPGQYQFRVAAFEMNDPDQVVEASIEVTQKPHFYRTYWFVGLTLALAATLVWAAYQLRLRQLHSRFSAVLQERNRLAREMHDTLIQGCVGVSTLLEAHSSLGEPKNGTGDELLDYARTQLRFTIDEARQAVWNLRQSPAADIAPQLERMAEQIGHEFGVPIECRVSGKPFGFDQSTVHEVLMVAREALYNATRHGKPSAVHMDADFERDRCIVHISDDGAGFDPGALSVSANGHYGLIGIRERVERIGGEFTIDSRVGEGTRLTIEVPRMETEITKDVPEIKR